MKPNPKPHNYLEELLKQIPQVKTPGVVHVTVSHDPWCMVNNGGRCNCEPEVKPGTPNRAQRRADKRK